LESARNLFENIIVDNTNSSLALDKGFYIIFNTTFQPTSQDNRLFIFKKDMLEDHTTRY